MVAATATPRGGWWLASTSSSTQRRGSAPWATQPAAPAPPEAVPCGRLASEARAVPAHAAAHGWTTHSSHTWWPAGPASQGGTVVAAVWHRPEPPSLCGYPRPASTG